MNTQQVHIALEFRRHHGIAGLLQQGRQIGRQHAPGSMACLEQSLQRPQAPRLLARP